MENKIDEKCKNDCLFCLPRSAFSYEMCCIKADKCDDHALFECRRSMKYINLEEL